VIDTVLIANRGCIATRILRTLKKLGMRSVVIYHEDDVASQHVQLADVSVSLGGGTAAQTYLDAERIIAIAKEQGAQAIHPGYGFLSENEDFVARCEAAGLRFVGPTPQQINLFGLKHQARAAAEQAGVPLVPGSGLLTDLAVARHEAARIGYPVMLKSTAGGGGIGMQMCEDESALVKAWDSVRRLGGSYFANDGVFLEKFVRNARHIEVQIFGDGKGTAVALGERDCSAQRRNQKVIEECPAPNLKDSVRAELCRTAEALMGAVSYRNAGTVEFILDADTEKFYFLEVNTRLQVEHGVTEEVWGVDLVEWMVRLAAGTLPALRGLRDSLQPEGHAIQVRLYAEDPGAGFQPSPGLLSSVAFPESRGLRVDTWVQSGITVSSRFDPMVAKVITHGVDRAAALAALLTHLGASELYGTETNLDYLRQLLASAEVQQGRVLTSSLARFRYQQHSVTVLQGGTMTTVQDYPGRTGLWHVGVPPSGPMDSLHFRFANALLGNDTAAAALEITLNGPTLRFNADTTLALCGAEAEVALNGKPQPLFTTLRVRDGDELKVGKITGNGARLYLAVQGGLRCPDYLGSKATFTLGQFGGHNGRALRAGDLLHFAATPTIAQQRSVPTAQRPEVSSAWNLRVIYGPHGAPDFFTDADIAALFAHEWEVHYNSSRTGVRLIGPKPQWARDSGGEAGLHPSNIHDNAYAFGTVDFTGDMPVILGPDGPSLGGFVCPATVIHADLWKLGQLKAGAKVRFVPVTLEQALAEEQRQSADIAALCMTPPAMARSNLTSPIVHRDTLFGEELFIRVAGDHFLLIELGEQELDIERRLKIHALMSWLQEKRIKGLEELTPGIRSLQLHYQPTVLPLRDIIGIVREACRTLLGNEDIRVPTRTVYLPLSWDDTACQLAIEKYMQSVRKDAPWCPSNLEFIRRINGLGSIGEVKDIVFSASYLVLGLGDVYLGAPVATPLDPRQRLVTTKYNPARTWTAENSVGIGGAYLCIYGMEGPGGYQFVGRTLQMWNRYQRTRYFSEPWLLRFFDQIRFYPVSGEDLLEIREKFPRGQYPLRIEEGEFKLSEYRRFLAENDGEITAFRDKRSAAFSAELEYWKANGLLRLQEQEAVVEQKQDETVPDGLIAIGSPASGSIWKITAPEGSAVEQGGVCVILESMKMEIEIRAPGGGVINRLLIKEGQTVHSGQALLWLEESA
jgi:urea carboxylase